MGDPMENVFGTNLRQLCGRRPSIASVARDLDIGKVQFNRYLTGESIPKPPVLRRICLYFGVDARVLLDPLERVEAQRILESVAVDFPPGFYEVSSLSMRVPGYLLRTLCFAWFDGQGISLRWHFPRVMRSDVMRLPVGQGRIGAARVLRSAQGYCVMTTLPVQNERVFTYWQETSLAPGVYLGFSTHGVAESAGNTRGARCMLRRVDDGFGAVRQVIRGSGLVSVSEASKLELMALRPEVPFS